MSILIDGIVWMIVKEIKRNKQSDMTSDMTHTKIQMITGLCELGLNPKDPS